MSQRDSQINVMIVGPKKTDIVLHKMKNNFVEIKKVIGDHFIVLPGKLFGFSPYLKVCVDENGKLKGLKRNEVFPSLFGTAVVAKFTSLEEYVSDQSDQSDQSDLMTLTEFDLEEIELHTEFDLEEFQFRFGYTMT